MLFLTAGILCNVLLLIILKAFSRFGIPSLQGIVVNYFVAGTTALFFIGDGFTIDDIIHSDWIKASVTLGFLFISIFYLISLTAQKISISVASVANKMSVVIPVCIAFMLYGDSISIWKITGILLALASVYLTTKTRNTGTSKDSSSVVLPLLVFIGSGIIDAIVNYTNKRLIHSSKEDALFTSAGFYCAGIIGLICLSWMILVKKEKIIFKSIIGGICLGIPNFFSIYFILKALSTNVLESSQLYPVANIFIVLLSAIAGVWLFKEKLSQINIIGIGISVLSIVLIMIK
jgi:drug/metabolite transporter (DMT)-like permease